MRAGNYGSSTLQLFCLRSDWLFYFLCAFGRVKFSLDQILHPNLHGCLQERCGVRAASWATGVGRALRTAQTSVEDGAEQGATLGALWGARDRLRSEPRPVFLRLGAL